MDEVIVIFDCGTPGEWSTGPRFVDVAADEEAAARRVQDYANRPGAYFAYQPKPYDAANLIKHGYFRLQTVQVHH